MVLKENMGLEELRREVSETTGIELTKLWYNLKYDRGMVMKLEGDDDVRMFMKGNDEHGYLYMGESNRLKSGRDRDDIVQQGCNGVGVKRAAVRGCGGCSDDHPQTRLRKRIWGRTRQRYKEGNKAAKWALGEAWEEDGQAQAGDDEVEEWGGGENRAEVG
ncbi:LOW QUALITY PROTEIN: hypothetical protein Cgig2_002714 [Carnegiea gigantea]|uniref:Uncharacterized protein n=1 Tax=Carnegiea gigantea TaxID=171969 RepID=A0A9Q1GLW5_9CARY|nr:LOW QUALITY PROTEIN: hypothetical protein Cgig2_002714 [Carnegiea gigantea]